jgi:hypothetical protein
MKKTIIILSIVCLAIIAMATTSVRSARLVSELTVTENLVTPTTSTYIDINGLNEVVNYRDGSTRYDADNVWADTVLNDGTIDLTSLTNSLGESLDLTDDVIVAVKFFLEDDSAATCTISQGAADPYLLFGATYSFQLKANQSLLFKADTVLPVVSATAKDIDYDSSNDSTALYIILLTADGYQ